MVDARAPLSDPLSIVAPAHITVEGNTIGGAIGVALGARVRRGAWNLLRPFIPGEQCIGAQLYERTCLDSYA